MSEYVVATVKPWNIEAFHRRARGLPGNWHLIEGREGFTAEHLAAIGPRYIFFPHWSWIVPEEILSRYECVCFHMADVPYGRGGSPLQNLIARGHRDTKLSALRMTAELDAGPVYMKRPLDLGGRAEEIFIRTAELSYDMMGEIAAAEPAPQPQEGAPVVFRRRTPEMSALPAGGDMEALYDHIRMLDAPTYPPAFLDHGEFRLEFSHAEAASDGTLCARVAIRRRGET